MYEQKKEKFINVLNNNFGSHNVFPEIANISDEDFKKIIELYEQKASVDGKDPWNYLYFDELIIMQQCLYEVIKDNYRYNDITSKVEILFEQELNRRLQKLVRSYGDDTDETYRASYAEMPEYALTLADMCTRKMEAAQKSFAETKEVELPERSLSTYKEISKDFTASGIQMPERSESIAQSTQTLITLRAEEKDALIEKEKEQREIQLITLQQEINRIENEKLGIEKRIRQISSETLGSSFSRQVSKKYPTEYQTYQQHKEQEKNHRSIFAQITDLEAKLKQVSQDLQFYKNVLPAYECFYQRFQQMKTERQQNLIEEREQERLKQLAKAKREDLIDREIRKDLSVAGDYHLSDAQIKNPRVEFDGYSDEKLRSFVDDVKLEEGETKVQRNNLINEILDMMYPDGLDYVPLPDIKKQLDKKSTEELQAMVQQFTSQTLEDSAPKKI